MGKSNGKPVKQTEQKMTEAFLADYISISKLQKSKNGKFRVVRITNDEKVVELTILGNKDSELPIQIF